jgi:hypothetical protein
MADIVNDGGVVGFSRLLTINGVTYSSDDFKLDTPVGTSFTRTDEKSRPTGKVDVKGVTTGSATLQLATEGTALPEFGMTFIEDEGTMKVLTVGRAETKSGETKVAITFEKAITGSVVVS